MTVDYLPVDDADRGLPLDEFLAAQFPRWTKGYLRGLIREGRISIDGQPEIVASTKLHGNAVVGIDLPEEEVSRPQIRTSSQTEIRVLYEDEALWVIDKPAGIAVEPERWDREGAHLAGAVLDHLERGIGVGERLPFRPRVVHRIDKGTSGVLCFAKNLEAERAVRAQFEEGSVTKRYLALVEGEVPPEGGTVDLPIGPDAKKDGKMRVDRTGTGKRAHTRYELARAYRGFSLVGAYPKTGRTHQIRVHLAARGFPLLVDPLYGRREELFLSEFKPGYVASKRHKERPLIARLTLHAAGLALRSPAAGEIAIESDPPKDFAATMTQLERWRGR
ncbi:MAG: RluA family pseudouridine synthase [Planctomycetes bacterium]|nr:RluA family pseudouridine synthase [Planctomycetota bacterium]